MHAQCGTPRWRTQVATEVVFSDDGVGDLLNRLQDVRAFLIIDQGLASQKEFQPLLQKQPRYLFDATASEPRTCDVDFLKAHIERENLQPQVIAGIGGGATMDLAKALGICLANPEPAVAYQGWSLSMNKGADIWVLPTLNGTGAELTPIAVLRGPERKLGINNDFVIPSLAIIDPQLSRHVKKINRFLL